MKIIQILPSLHMGGGEKFAIDLSNELINNNQEVIICVLSSIDKKLNLYKNIDKRIKVISLNKKRSFDIVTFFTLFKLIIKEKPDIIHTHLRALIYSSLIVIFTKNKFFHTIHNIANKEISKNFQKIHKIFFKYFNVTPISISNYVLESTKELYGKNFNELVYNGVKPCELTTNLKKVKNELNSYKVNEHTKILLNIGRVSKQKNQELLINSVNELIEEGNNICLIIIGSIENEPEYYKICHKLLKSKNNIKFLGEKNNISDYLYCSDLFCMSSIYEGLPLVILEAMSLGKYTICTPAGGSVDVIHNNINGYITTDFSKEKLKNAIRENLNYNYNDEDIKNIFNTNYSMKICANNYLNLYKGIKN
jgi:glycosyltransferase involved in cell wall biosynthesis